MTAQARRNDALAYWITRAQVSYAGLSKELRNTARDRGIRDVQPDRSRIARWINDGEQPRPPVPDILAVTLTRLCGLPRPLSPSDLGLTGPIPAGPGADWHPRAVIAAIISLTRSDAVTDDTTPSTTGLLSGAQLLETVQPWLHLSTADLPDPTRPGRLGMSDVARIQATTDAFRALDNTHGGGLSRRAVVGQLQDVTTLATHGRVSDDVGRALFTSIADLASVAGWMTHDVGRHAEAQRYFLVGLQAAKQAGPAGAGIGGHLLNCLARQANHLGRAEDALELVQAAQYGTRKLPAGRLRAMLTTLEARCHAVLGHLPETSRAIGAAQDALAADQADGSASWSAWFDTAEYHVTVGVCEHLASRHDPARAVAAVDLIRAGTAQRPGERTRSQAFDHIALARAHVSARQYDAADEAAATALDLLGRVTSTRVTDRLRELDHELAGAPNPVTASTRERVRAALQPAA